jgi:hypothetical protein
LKVHSARRARLVALAALVALASLAFAAAPALADHEGVPSGVSLVPEKNSVTIPESIKLTANADRHLYGTGYTVAVIDDDSGLAIGSPCEQTPCAKYGGTSWADNPNPQARRFHAELRGPGGGTAASSGQVTVGVDKHIWNVVSVVPNPAERVVPGSIQFVATLDHTTYGTPYSIYIYDEDDPASPPTSCNQYICGRYVSRGWGDNANPKSGHVRVEVRNSSGDVASSTVYASGQFRRFIFTPTLSFWTKTWSGGNVDQMASARMVSTDPSLYGTGYKIKIKKADGSQLCSAPQVGCDATVAVGGTYRAVVEDSQGRNFGDSGAFTLTADGTLQEVIDDVDLAYLAGQFPSSTAICNALAEYPGTNLMEPHSSLSDQYRTCVTVATTSTRIGTLRAIAEAVGGGVSLGALWYLQREAVRPSPPPGTPWTADDVKAPKPVPLPLLPQVDRLADTLVQQNSTLSQPIADDIAWQCQWLTGPLGLNAKRECGGQPIFASGNDVPRSTEHDIDALAYWPPWVALNYRHQSETPGDRLWMNAEDECQDRIPSVTSCDEYPFWATMQGGPFAVKQPHLELIPFLDNRDQGLRYGNFILNCHMNTGDGFLGIPLAPELGIPTQTRVCNGH